MSCHRHFHPKRQVKSNGRCHFSCTQVLALKRRFRIRYTVICFISHFFLFFVCFLKFGGRHVSELPTCEIISVAKRHFVARILFVTNRLPVRVLDKPIISICVTFRVRVFLIKMSCLTLLKLYV